MLEISSEIKYSRCDPASPFTYTWIVEVSMKGLSRINFWSRELSNINFFVKYVPWLTVIFSNLTIYLLFSIKTGFTIFSDIENVNEESCILPVQTKPL